MAQACHAMAEFTNHRGQEWLDWLRHSNYIVVLAVPNEEALLHFADVIGVWDGILVREPDIGDEATALVIVPGEHYRKVAHLPLALKETAMA